ncbi:MAG: hypothetical protein IPN79_03855 [Saprospiraceae bacterium]|nr:hypothetical protein [Saprospiraceae bacterium]
MIQFFTFCDIPWWLTWILPFLLGLALGWLLWSRFKNLFDESQTELTQSQQKISDLQFEITSLKKQVSLLDGDLALCRGRVRELETSGIESSGATLIQSTGFAAPATSNQKWAAAIGSDQLQIIEGIGPKMEAILKENGIPDFLTLAGTNVLSLRDMLNKYGDKYRIIDPSSWPAQAEMAQKEQYADLISMQKSLDGGRADTATNETDSKLEKFLIKAGIIKQWKQDDLKAIEGIGPKIEGLLKENGITTWAALGNTTAENLRNILEKAGPRFQLAEPSTWPKQAMLAAEGNWDELMAYQDALNGGKES